MRVRMGSECEQESRGWRHGTEDVVVGPGVLAIFWEGDDRGWNLGGQGRVTVCPQIIMIGEMHHLRPTSDSVGWSIMAMHASEAMSVSLLKDITF